MNKTETSTQIPIDNLTLVIRSEALKCLTGTSNGIPNIWFLIQIISHMAKTDTTVTRRGITYPIKAGQSAVSQSQLAEEAGVSRKVVDAALQKLHDAGLVTVAKDKLGSIIEVNCLQRWFDTTCHNNPGFHGYAKGSNTTVLSPLEVAFPFKKNPVTNK